MMFKNPVMIVVCLAMMVAVSWQLTVFVFVLLPLAGMVMGRVGRYTIGQTIELLILAMETCTYLIFGVESLDDAQSAMWPKSKIR